MPEPPSGYHYRTLTQVGVEEVETLLDGGSVFSLMSEEYFVELINSATSRGMTPAHEDWPIAGLQHWGADSPASTMSKGPALLLRAIVLLRMTLKGLGGERHRMVVRVRIARSGSIGRWRGIILGAPVLDAPPLGLGHEPRVGGHYFRALGFMTLRLEESSVQKGLEGLLVAACGHGSAMTSHVEVSAPHPFSGMPLYFLKDSEPEASAFSDVFA